MWRRAEKFNVTLINHQLKLFETGRRQAVGRIGPCNEGRER